MREIDESPTGRPSSHTEIPIESTSVGDPVDEWGKESFPASDPPGGWSGVEHYAEAFSIQPGRCFRFVGKGVGHAAHCREPVVARGTFVDGNGRRWEVDACEGHREELEHVEGGRDRPPAALPGVGPTKV